MVCVISIDQEMRYRLLSNLLCTNVTALNAFSAQWFHSLGLEFNGVQERMNLRVVVVGREGIAPQMEGKMSGEIMEDMSAFMYQSGCENQVGRGSEQLWCDDDEV